MAIQIQGNGGTVAEVDGTTFRAQRFTPRPVDHGSLGHYNYGGSTGILPAALAANSEIFQFRWTDATRFAVIRRIRLSASVTTTMFAAGVPVEIDLVKATGWTGQGTGGTGNNLSTFLKARTSMGSTLVGSGDLRIATTAALGAGTKTLETEKMNVLVAGGPITGSLNGTIIAAGTPLWEAEPGDGGHPLILAQNEGFVIRSVAVPATGTWRAAFQVSWAEVTAY